VDRGTRDKMTALAGPVAIALSGVAMAWWTWGTWPDVLIDFGRELYIPWQLSQGKVLYRDIAHFNGPLSQYLNALWFRLFGVGLWTLVWCNLALLATTVVVLHRIFLAIGSRLSATMACLTFVALSGFGQLVRVGNYNFVCPYSHGVTHGALLSAVALLLAMHYVRRRRLRHVAGAGLALGLAFLTKPEVFLPGAVGTALGVGLSLWSSRASARQAARVVGVLAGAAVVPPLLAFALLWRAMPAGHAVQGTVGTWWYLLSRQPLRLPAFRAGMGVSDPLGGLLAMLGWAARYVVVLVPCAALAVAMRRPGRWRPVVSVGLLVAIAGLLWANWMRIRWHDAARPLPLAMLAAAGALAAVLVRQRRRGERLDATIVRLCVVAFAFTLLLKMVLNARLYHYGFVLAVPAAMVLLVALVDWVPALVRRVGGYAPAFAAAVAGVWLAAMGVHLRVNASYIARKTEVVSSGADAFLARERGPAVRLALGEIERRVGAAHTLAVFPEGVMLNYLSRRGNPTPYINFMPLELALFGEGRIVEAYRAHPPDFVVLVHKDTAELGFRFFGQDYARGLFSWIRADYRPVLVIGAPPLRDHRFGIQLLRRAGSR